MDWFLLTNILPSAATVLQRLLSGIVQLVLFVGEWHMATDNA